MSGKDLLNDYAQQVAHKQTSIRTVANRSVSQHRHMEKRRGRPRKIIIDAQQLHNNGNKSTYESFTTSCTGVSFGCGTNQKTNNLSRKRSLPLLSFLSSTTLAKAERKRKREKRERQDAIAREEASKILLLSQKHTTFAEDANDATTNGNHAEVEAKTSNIRIWGGDNNLDDSDTGKSAKEENAITPSDTTTVEIEHTSNVLMPPLLQKLLTQVDKQRPYKSSCDL